MAGRVECVAGVERTRVESEWVVAVGGGSRLAGWLAGWKGSKKQVRSGQSVWHKTLANLARQGKARLGKGGLREDKESRYGLQLRSNYNNSTLNQGQGLLDEMID